MRKVILKRFAAVSALSLAAMLGTSVVANAQGNSNHDRKQEQKLIRQQEKIHRERAKMDQQRQNEWTRRNTRIVNTRNTRVVTGGYYTVEPTVNVSAGNYRVYRNGSYYNTDNRGADLLRQAVNEGYRQGFAAGRSDRSGRRNGGWLNSGVYRTGTYGYQRGVNRSQYQYYFQQGFQRGYQDGSNSQYQEGYSGNYQYGYNEDGKLNILGTILNGILNISRY